MTDFTPSNARADARLAQITAAKRSTEVQAAEDARLRTIVQNLRPGAPEASDEKRANLVFESCSSWVDILEMLRRRLVVLRAITDNPAYETKHREMAKQAIDWITGTIAGRTPLELTDGGSSDRQ